MFVIPLSPRLPCGFYGKVLLSRTGKGIAGHYDYVVAFVVNKEFIDYALPLIQGTPDRPLENGLPRFARLKKIQAK